MLVDKDCAAVQIADDDVILCVGLREMDLAAEVELDADLVGYRLSNRLWERLAYAIWGSDDGGGTSYSAAVANRSGAGMDAAACGCVPRRPPEGDGVKSRMLAKETILVQKRHFDKLGRDVLQRHEHAIAIILGQPEPQQVPVAVEVNGPTVTTAGTG